MPDPVTITVAGLVATAALAKLVEKIIKDVYESTKDKTAALAKLYSDRAQIAILVEKLASVRLVKTIWQVDKALDLQEFYNPTRVHLGDSRKEIKSLDSISVVECLVLTGLVGQGKSIFLRYLACQELIKGKRIPLFIELHRLAKEKNPKPLTDAICSKLADLGLHGDEATFKAFADEGRIVLFLDAFDELDEDCVKHVLNELHSFRQRYEKLQIVVTTRPDTDVCRSVAFRVLRLAFVERSEIRTLIARLVDDPELLKNISGALEAATPIHDVLVTPLMITLLVISYRARGSLPESLAGFYEELVPILLTRHDKSKPGFNRRRTCGLSDHKIREVFEVFCFVAKKMTGTTPTLTDRQVHECAARALAIASVTAEETAFVRDIVRITCLLLEEGGIYSFLHKSVQEFGAAAYIRRLTNDSSEAFFKRMLGKWREWQVELSFLADIDEYRFDKFFRIKDLEKAIARIFQLPPTSVKRITDVAVQNLLEMFQIVLNPEARSKHVRRSVHARDLYYTISPSGIEYEWVIYRSWIKSRPVNGARASMHGIAFSVTDEHALKYIELLAKRGEKPKLSGREKGTNACDYKSLLIEGVLPRETVVAAKAFLQDLLTQWKETNNRITKRELQDKNAIDDI